MSEKTEDSFAFRTLICKKQQWILKGTWHHHSQIKTVNG